MLTGETQIKSMYAGPQWADCRHDADTPNGTLRPVQKSILEGEMQIWFERDSVCAGDDVLAPNSKVVAFRATPRISEILHEAGPIIDYLPCVHASRAHWLVFIDKECVARVSFTCEPCRSLAVTMLVSDRHVEAERVYFSAAGQERTR
jgi:hypothetical protein